MTWWLLGTYTSAETPRLRGQLWVTTEMGRTATYKAEIIDTTAEKVIAAQGPFHSHFMATNWIRFQFPGEMQFEPAQYTQG